MHNKISTIRKRIPKHKSVQLNLFIKQIFRVRKPTFEIRKNKKYGQHKPFTRFMINSYQTAASAKTSDQQKQKRNATGIPTSHSLTNIRIKLVSKLQLENVFLCSIFAL